MRLTKSNLKKLKKDNYYKKQILLINKILKKEGIKIFKEIISPEILKNKFSYFNEDGFIQIGYFMDIKDNKYIHDSIRIMKDDIASYIENSNHVKDFNKSNFNITIDEITKNKIYITIKYKESYKSGDFRWF